MKKSILFPVAIEGQFYQVKAFRDVLSTPVAVITMTQQIEDALRHSDVVEPDRVYSLPQFYLEQYPEVNGMTIVDLKGEVSRFESRYNITSGARMIASDRYFQSLKNSTTVLQHMVIFYRFVDHIFACETNVLAVKANLTTFFGLALNAVADTKEIPAIKHQTARVNGRVEFTDGVEWGVLRGWRSVYQGYIDESSHGPADESWRKASIWLADFLSAPDRPVYAKRNSVLQFNAKKLSRHICSALVTKLSMNYWRQYRAYPVDRKLTFSPPLTRRLVGNTVAREAKAAVFRRLRYFKEQADFNTPYIYFPLQFVPELTTLAYAVPNNDQLAVITALSKSIPGEVVIYVKEHTSMIGRRSLRFYKTLDSLHNVKVISPRISTFDLIDSAVAVATLTGTPGWEAFLRRKPVIAFGQAFYCDFPNVLHLCIGGDMSSRIRHYLDTFEPASDLAIEAVVAAYFEVTAETTSVDIGVDTRREDAADNARRLAEAYRRQIFDVPIPSAETEFAGTRCVPLIHVACRDKMTSVTNNND